MVFIGKLLTTNGVNVIFDAVANRKRWREKAREDIPRFLEIFVNTPLEICRQRDPKGIYKSADRGDSLYVPGQQQVYEAPSNPEIVVDGQVSPEESAGKIVEVMRNNGFI
jgi:adenylylsulfate kinase-like enzyme